MTQEQRKLVLIDLCARLTYGVQIEIEGCRGGVLKGIDGDTISTDRGINYPLRLVKPYLRPMSSMTIDELDDCVTNDGLSDIPCPNYEGSKEECEQQRLEHSIKVFKTDAYRVDWLNAHHFDYRGLIPMGLALEAPEDMYKIK